jgi:hypothetical protein
MELEMTDDAPTSKSDSDSDSDSKPDPEIEPESEPESVPDVEEYDSELTLDSEEE